jgi:hypothetical protein
MPRSITITFNGSKYIWNGKRWFDRKTCLEPPTVISSKLNTMVASQRRAKDKASAENMDNLLRKAKKAQYQGQIPKALARQVHNRRPQHIGTAAILCSVLRTANKSKEAVALANNFSSSNYSPLLTARAAALCDLNRWDDALKQIRQVFTIRMKSKKSSGNDEALAVYSRIKQNASHLFEERRPY